jgi:hypothetical protein
MLNQKSCSQDLPLCMEATCAGAGWPRLELTKEKAREFVVGCATVIVVFANTR